MENIDPAVLLLLVGLAVLAILVNRRARFIATIVVLILLAVAATQVFLRLKASPPERILSKSPRR